MRDFKAYLFVIIFAVLETFSATIYSEVKYGISDNVLKEIEFDPCMLMFVQSTTITYKEIPGVPNLEKEKTGTIKRPKKISDKDFDDLVRIGWCEAGLEGFEGICLVYDTVLNRVRDPRFPSTVHDVLYAPGQYSTVHTGKFKTCTPSKECYEALEFVLQNGVTNKDVLYFGRSPITNKNVFKHNHHYFSS